MQSADRIEFERQAAVLCAAFNVPATDARVDAYWRGLEHMSLAQFTRVVEVAIGRDGPEKIPTTNGLWQLHRKQRAGISAPAPSKPREPEYNYDRWDAGANMALIKCAMKFGNRDSKMGWQIAREAAAWFRSLAEDGDPEATYPRMCAAIERQYATLPPDADITRKMDEMFARWALHRQVTR